MEQINTNPEKLTPQENRDQQALESMIDRYDPDFRLEIIEELAKMSPKKFDAVILAEKISHQYTPEMYNDIIETIHQMSNEELAKLKITQQEKEELESHINNQIETKRRELIDFVITGMVQTGAITEEKVGEWRESALKDRRRFSLPVLQNDLRRLCRLLPDLCGPGTIWDDGLAA